MFVAAKIQKPIIMLIYEAWSMQNINSIKKTDMEEIQRWYHTQFNLAGVIDLSY